MRKKILIKKHVIFNIENELMAINIVKLKKYNELKKNQEKLKLIDKEIKLLNNKNIKEKINKITNKIKAIENNYRKANIENQLNFNTEYLKLKINIKKLEKNNLEKEKIIISNNIQTLHVEIKNINFRIDELMNQKNKEKKEIKENKEKKEIKENKNIESSKNKIKNENNTINNTNEINNQKDIDTKKAKKNIRFSFREISSNQNDFIGEEVSWENIEFYDGYIKVKHKGNLYTKNIKKSKKILNSIKHYYKFHNVPKLKITTKRNTITKLENEEYLFFHIAFLNVTASNIDNFEKNNFQISNWTKYNKDFYKNNLPILFKTVALKKLCEISYSSAPIIPVGEIIINNGKIKIHSSFLFPIKSINGCFIVWESTEESKASYVFKISTFNDLNIQEIYNYISSNIQNKREKLIYSKDLKNHLKLQYRIVHTDLNDWKNKLSHI
jgi:hypothetical protein